jgi:putative FmdB family regulatory protein
MPLYEYLCDECGHRFEVIQKFSDPLIEKCPKCGGPVHKVMSPPAIQFKGSGFYITDYPKDAKRGKDKEGKEGKSETPAKDAKEGGKSDAAAEKPAASSDKSTTTSSSGSGSGSKGTP